MTIIGTTARFKNAARSPSARLQRGRASDHIAHALDHLKSGDYVILICRVSRHEQERRGNLADSEANLRRVAEKFGAIVVDVHRRVASGTDPYWLASAVQKAKDIGAVLLAETTDRLMRHPAYHSKNNPDAQARSTDLSRLAWWAEGVVMVTDLHPDASPSEVRSYQRQRGQWAKRNRGGRPPRTKCGHTNEPGYKKQRRKELKSSALKLRRQGLSWRAVGVALGVAESTLRGWI